MAEKADNDEAFDKALKEVQRKELTKFDASNFNTENVANVMKLAMKSKVDLVVKHKFEYDIPLDQLAVINANFQKSGFSKKQIDEGHLAMYPRSNIRQVGFDDIGRKKLNSFYDPTTQEPLIKVDSSHIAYRDTKKLKNLKSPYFTKDEIQNIEKDTNVQVHGSHKLRLSLKDFPDVPVKDIVKFYKKHGIDDNGKLRLLAHPESFWEEQDFDLDFNFSDEDIERGLKEGMTVDISHLLRIPPIKNTSREVTIDDIAKASSEPYGTRTHPAHLAKIPTNELFKHQIEPPNENTLRKIKKEGHYVDTSHYARFPKSIVDKFQFPNTDSNVLKSFVDAMQSDKNLTGPWVHPDHLEYASDEVKKFIETNNAKYANEENSKGRLWIFPRKTTVDKVAETGAHAKVFKTHGGEHWTPQMKVFMTFRNDVAVTQRLVYFVNSAESRYEKNVYMRAKDNERHEVLFPVPYDPRTDERAVVTYEAISGRKYAKGARLKSWSLLEDHIRRLCHPAEDKLRYRLNVNKWFDSDERTDVPMVELDLTMETRPPYTHKRKRNVYEFRKKFKAT